MGDLLERFIDRRFDRQAAHRYCRMAIRYRACRRTCLRCALLRATGQFRTERIRMVERSRAMRATTSWWPTEKRTTTSGRTYRIAVKPDH